MSAPFYRLYREDAANTLYNLLFCDNRDGFAAVAASVDSPLKPIFAPKLDERSVRALALDRAVEARLRALAFNRLREEDREVPSGVLLGTIVEVPLANGQDTLAVYDDRRVRYINQSGKMAIIEERLPTLEPKIAAVLAASSRAVGQIGPWDGDRLPPPHPGRVRLTFLTSNGLCLGDGPMDALMNDGIGGPVLQSASQLLNATIELVLARKKK